MTRTMGLDLSLTSTGISMNGLTSAYRPTTKGIQRLVDISDHIRDLCMDNAIEVVALEGYSFASRSSHAHSIGEAGGCVKVLLHNIAVPVVIIPPTCRAKFATGRGNASKLEVVSAISVKTGIVWLGASGDDQCDAWVLEQMLLAHSGTSQYDWTKTQMDALTKIDWTGTNE